MNVIIRAIAELSKIAGNKMFLFNRDSGLAQIWYILVKDGKEEKEAIPEISNLKEIVLFMLTEEESQGE
jgi:hypothetical protein